MELRPSTNYFPWTGAIIPLSIIIEKHGDKTDIRYSAEAHLYCSAQPSIFTHIVLSVDVSTFFPFNSSIKHLLCAVVVAAYCLLSSDKKGWNTAWRGHCFLMSLFLSLVMRWNVSMQYHQYTHIYFHHTILVVFGEKKYQLTYQNNHGDITHIEIIHGV